jgi:hypothetical protein
MNRHHHSLPLRITRAYAHTGIKPTATTAGFHRACDGRSGVSQPW